MQWSALDTAQQLMTAVLVAVRSSPPLFRLQVFPVPRPPAPAPGATAASKALAMLQARRTPVTATRCDNNIMIDFGAPFIT